MTTKDETAVRWASALAEIAEMLGMPVGTSLSDAPKYLAAKLAEPEQVEPSVPAVQPLLFSQRKAIADKLNVAMDSEFNSIVRQVEAEHGIGAPKQPATAVQQVKRRLAPNALEVSVRANINGTEFAVCKQWAEAWALSSLERIVANDINTIKKQINEAATHGIGAPKGDV